MSKFIIDENLPYKFSLWDNEGFIHQYEVEDIKSDEDIWEYARKTDLLLLLRMLIFLIVLLFQILH